MLADVHLSPGWSWLVLALGAGIIAVGALLFSPNSHDQPAPATSTTWGRQ
jgi:hypothetical protein